MDYRVIITEDAEADTDRFAGRRRWAGWNGEI